MPRCLLRCVFVAGLVLAGMIVPRSGRAGEVPVTSLSNATLVPGGLLDQVALTFLYPQHAPMHASQVFAFASTADAQQGIGGIASPHHYGVFATSQPYERLSFRADDTLRLFQIGLALRGGPLRIGAAVRGSRTKDLTTRRDDFGFERRTVEQGATLSYRETALGLGIGEGDLFLDAEFDLRIEELVSESTETRDLDVRGTRVEAEGKSRPGFAARAGVPWGDIAALRLAGTWRDQTFDQRVETALRDSSGVIVTEEEVDGRRWDVAAAVQSPAASASLWRAWVSYEEEENFTRWRFGDEQTSTDTQQFRAGISLEHDAWWATRLYGGIRGAWISRTVTSSRLSPDTGGVFSTETETEETLHEFAWGASRTFGQVDLIASVSTNLSLSDLFATLDAGFRF